MAAGKNTECPSAAENWRHHSGLQKLPHSEQLKAFSSFLTLLESCGRDKDSIYTNSLFLMGVAHANLNQAEKALRTIGKAIAAAKQFPNGTPKHFLAKYCFYFGYYAGLQGDKSTMLSSYQQCLSVGRNHFDKWGLMGVVCQQLAFSYAQAEDYEQALEYSNYGLDFARKKKDISTYTNNLYEKTRSLYQLSRLQEADSLALEMLTLGKEAGPEAQALFFKLAGDIAEETGDKTRAIKYYRHAERKFAAAGDAKGLEMIMVNLYHLYSNGHNIKFADQFYNRCLKQVKDSLYLSSLIVTRALLLEERGLVEESLAHIETSLNYLPFKKNKEGYIPARLLYLLPSKEYLFHPLKERARVLLKSGAEKRDQETLLKAQKTFMVVDSLIDFLRWEHVNNRSKLFWRNKVKNIYEQALQTSYLLNDPASFFYFLEKSKGVMLLDRLNELKAGQFLSKTDQVKSEKLNRDISELRSLITEEPAEEKKALLRTRLFIALEAQRQFFTRIKTTNPAYYTYKYDNDVPDLSAFRRALGDSQGYCSFFEGDEASYGLYADREKVIIRKFGLKQYREALAEFGGYATDKSRQNKDFSGYLRAANKIYQLLVDPFQIKKGVRLIISPDGPLLPFAAFSRSAEKEDFLIRHHAISYTYSAAYLTKTERKPVPWYAARHFLGVAPVDFQAHLKQISLPGSREALGDLSRRFLFSKTLEGPRATKKAFLENLAYYPVVQLFSHASAGSAQAAEQSPLLYFADDFLKVSDLDAPAENNTQLLVLSACETSVGIDQRGEGVFSMARAFSAIGIPSVLTTLWQIENNASYRITAGFYEALEQNLPLDEALRRTQVAWLEKADKSDQLPFIWAGNVVIGNTAPIPPGLSPGLFWAASLTVLLLAGLFLFVKRK